jgi:uncharacterized Zn finger protein (UPF0148 family)
MNGFTAQRYHVDDDKGSFDMLKVRCPRCRLTFWVLGLWLHRRGGTACCPYCGRRGSKPKTT